MMTSMNTQERSHPEVRWMKKDMTMLQSCSSRIRSKRATTRASTALLMPIARSQAGVSETVGDVLHNDEAAPSETTSGSTTVARPHVCDWRSGGQECGRVFDTAAELLVGSRDICWSRKISNPTPRPISVCRTLATTVFSSYPVVIIPTRFD